MHLQTSGMEFASEMVINAAKANLRIAEVPVTYYPRLGESKLHSFRDGWRHLRFMLLYSPDWLFMIPGVLMVVLGLIPLLALLRGPVVAFGLTFDTHYMVLGSLLVLLGYQVIALGIYAKSYSVRERFEQRDPLLETIWRVFNLERGIQLGGFIFAVGLAINAYILYIWLARGFQGQPRLREAILAMTLMVIGAQTVFSSFFLSILGIERQED